MKQAVHRMVLIMLLIVGCWGDLGAALQQTIKTGINYSHAAFRDGEHPTLFVAAGAPGGQASALSRADLITMGEDGETPLPKPLLTITSLAPEKAMVNGVENQNNPLFNKNFSALTLFDSTPLVTVAGQPFLYWVINELDGSSVIKNPQPFKDFDGVPLDHAPSVIATREKQIFALLETVDVDNNQVFDIAVVGPDPDEQALTVQQTVPLLFTAASQATGNQQFAFFAPEDSAHQIGRAESDGGAVLHWNPYLQRLYFGFSGMRRNDHTKTGGVMALGLGIPQSNGEFDVVPALFNLNRGQLYNPASPRSINVANAIVGFYFNAALNPAAAVHSGNLPLALSITKMASLRTSTGRDYLIVVGQSSGLLVDLDQERDDNTIQRGVFALPLVSQHVDPNVIGTIAKPDLSGPVETLVDMPRTTLPANHVGGGLLDPDVATINDGEDNGENPLFDPRFLSDATQIKDLFVVGDAVYIAVDTVQKSTSGIFYSVAIVNHTGVIIDWTPWRRAMGSVERLVAAGRDQRLGNYYFLGSTDFTQPNPLFDKVSVTQWGASDGVTNQQNNFSSALEKIFPVGVGGVYQLFDTNSGSEYFDNISVVAAVGFDTVALLKTSGPVGDDLAVADTFDENNLVALKSPVLSQIAPLCTAAFTQRGLSSRDNLNGFFFVGGYRGAAVLSNADGRGYNTDIKLHDISLSPGSYPGDQYTFKPILLEGVGNPAPVRFIKLVGQDILLGTDRSLYALESQTILFDGRTPAEAVEFATLPDGARLSDFIAPWNGVPDSGARFLYLAATTKGLFVSFDLGVTWKEAPIRGKTGLPILQLLYLSNRRSFDGPNGNLYVLTADRFDRRTDCSLHRFVVSFTQQGIILQPVDYTDGEPGLFRNIVDFYGSAFIDGSQVLLARGKHFDNTDFVTALSWPPVSGLVSLTDSLAIDRKKAYNIGAIQQSSASGAMMIPGDWGIRVNQ